MNFKENLKKGALNLILNCAELSPHKKVLIVAENEKFGWYDKFVAKIVQKYCTELEIAANLLMIEEPTEENSYKIQKLSSKYDCIIYFSRLGDLKRFENVHSCKVVMSYARNINMLASQFGTTNYKIHLDYYDNNKTEDRIKLNLSILILFARCGLIRLVNRVITSLEDKNDNLTSNGDYYFKASGVALVLKIRGSG